MKKFNKVVCGIVVFVAAVLLGLSGTGGTQTVYAQGSYSVSGNTIDVQISDPSSAYDAIDSALAYAKDNFREGRIFTVRVPSGNYNISGTLHIYANTTLDLQGVNLQYTKSSGNMLMLGSPSYNKNANLMSGYGTVKNIRIQGGTWTGNNANTSSLIRMAHATDVSFEGCIFQQGGCTHQMEVAAIDGFTVKSCVFKDMYGNDKGGKKEALQIDMPCSEVVFSGIILDGTPMKNVLIDGCIFDNVPRGLGTHNMLIGQYHTNITITNNTFRDVDGECIIALNYRDCDIKNNTIIRCGAGITFEYFRPQVDDNEDIKAIYTTIYDGKQKFSGTNEADACSYISNNSISLNDERYADEYVGIRVYGYNLQESQQAIGQGSADIIPEHNYYISNVNVTGNTIRTTGYGIHFSDVRSSAISGNVITNTDENSWNDGICVDAESKDITINGNTVKKATRYGIGIDNFSTVSSISKNKISKTMYCGINLNDNSRVTGNIEKNVVTDSDDNGINLNDTCSVKNIIGNTVTRPNWHGINLYDGCAVTGKIADNKISGTKVNGIFLNKDSTAKTVSGNTLTNNSGYAIALYEGSQINGDITGNKITGNKKHAIQLKKDSTANRIKNNTIKDTRGKGICIENSSTIWEAISGNVIDKTTQEGIYIHSSLNALTIKGNKVSKCGRIPIVIDTTSKKKITISKNKLTVNKGKKPVVVLKGNVKSDIKEKKSKK